MKLKYYFLALIFIPCLPSNASAYVNLTPAQVHNRLVDGDTLLLLDVREVHEYEAGHIAEPIGRLPLTPANMPLNSNILNTEFHRLPKDIDILVYCRSGGRSAAASAFLETMNFSRIHNMTGGFSSWTFEKRDNGYGDHSGLWIDTSDTLTHIITSPEMDSLTRIIFPGSAMPGPESIYMELHFASWSNEPLPPAVPQSDMLGLYRVTLLDRYGVSLFDGDSLALSDTARLLLLPLIPTASVSHNKTSFNENMTVYIPGEGWRSVSFTLDELLFSRDETILRRWYNLEGYGYSKVESFSDLPDKFQFALYPNPFNGSIKILAPENARIEVYDIRGRFIKELTSRSWRPDSSISSGTYMFVMQINNQRIARTVVYLK